MPVMLVYGDSDMIRPEHIVQFYQLLGGGLKDAGWMRSTCRGTGSRSARSDALRDVRGAQMAKPSSFSRRQERCEELVRSSARKMRTPDKSMFSYCSLPSVDLERPSRGEGNNPGLQWSEAERVGKFKFVHAKMRILGKQNWAAIHGFRLRRLII